MNALAKDLSRFVETAIEDETVVMLLASGDFFALRDSAKAVWELIDGNRDEAQIVAAVAEDYGTDPQTVAGDVAAFIAELRATGLLTEA